MMLRIPAAALFVHLIALKPVLRIEFDAAGKRLPLPVQAEVGIMIEKILRDPVVADGKIPLFFKVGLQQGAPFGHERIPLLRPDQRRADRGIEDKSHEHFAVEKRIERLKEFHVGIDINAAVFIQHRKAEKIAQKTVLSARKTGFDKVAVVEIFRKRLVRPDDDLPIGMQPLPALDILFLILRHRRTSQPAGMNDLGYHRSPLRNGRMTYFTISPIWAGRLRRCRKSTPFSPRHFR